MNTRAESVSFEKVPFVRAKTEVLALLDDLYAAPKLLTYTKRADFPREVMTDVNVKESALATILKLDQLIGSMGQPVQRSSASVDQKREKHLTTLHAEKLELLRLCRGIIVNIFHLQVPSVMFELVDEVLSQSQKEQIEALRIKERFQVYKTIESWLLSAKDSDKMRDDVLREMILSVTKSSPTEGEKSGLRRVVKKEQPQDRLDHKDRSQLAGYFHVDDEDMAALRRLRQELAVPPKAIKLTDKPKRKRT